MLQDETCMHAVMQSCYFLPEQGGAMAHLGLHLAPPVVIADILKLPGEWDYEFVASVIDSTCWPLGPSGCRAVEL